MYLCQHLKSWGGWGRPRQEDARSKHSSCPNSLEGGVGGRGPAVDSAGEHSLFPSEHPDGAQDAHSAPDTHAKSTVHFLSQGPLGDFLRPAARPAAGKTSHRQGCRGGPVSFLSPGAPSSQFLGQGSSTLSRCLVLKSHPHIEV